MRSTLARDKTKASCLLGAGRWLESNEPRRERGHVEAENAPKGGRVSNFDGRMMSL